MPPQRPGSTVNLSIRDTRFIRGVQPLSRSKTSGVKLEESLDDHGCGETVEITGPSNAWDFDSVMRAAEAADEENNSHLCTACSVAVPAGERWQLLEHYQSGWHRVNLKRATKGKNPIGEEEWDDRSEEGDSDDGEGSSEEDTEENALLAIEGGARTYFNHDATVYSTYSALLREGEISIPATPSFFVRPFDCTIILLAGGHFAAGLFEKDRLAFHRSFHRYTVRAKQGGAQSMNDKSKGNAKSAGSNLRRYNEQRLRDEIRELLGKEWLVPIAASPLIFLRCASYQRGIFLGSEDEDPIKKGDARMRTIPFATHRPVLDELKRTWERLQETFERKFRATREAAEKKRQNAQRGRKKKVETELDAAQWEQIEEEEKQKRKERKEQTARVEVEEEKEEDPFPMVDTKTRTALYAALRANVEGGGTVSKMLDERTGEDGEALRSYLQGARLNPDGSSFLHVAAKMGWDNSLRFLLDYGLDVTVKDDDGALPYHVSENKAIRAVFIAWRGQLENCEKEEIEDKEKVKRKRIDWTRAQIPAPVEKTEQQLAEEAEKRKIKKDKLKVKLKARKEEEKKEAKEKQAREAFLALSDREKRALAAERRMAAMNATESRCFECAALIHSHPFEYGANKFCSTACVAEHRAKGLPQKRI